LQNNNISTWSPAGGDNPECCPGPCAEGSPICPGILVGFCTKSSSKLAHAFWYYFNERATRAKKHTHGKKTSGVEQNSL